MAGKSAMCHSSEGMKKTVSVRPRKINYSMAPNLEVAVIFRYMSFWTMSGTHVETNVTLILDILG